MTPAFECRYTQDWVFTKRLYAHTRKRDWPFVVFWSCFTLFLAGGAVVLLLSSGTFMFGVVAAMMALAAAWKGFGGRIRLRWKWKETCEKLGSDQIETVVSFGDRVYISSSDETALEYDWPDFEKLTVYDSGEYLYFKGNRKTGSLYIPRSGFADGTGEAFLAWLEQSHPAMFQ